MTPHELWPRLSMLCKQVDPPTQFARSFAHREMTVMERGELQRSLEAVEVRLHREISRREVFERKNAELERVIDDLRLENEVYICIYNVLFSIKTS